MQIILEGNGKMATAVEEACTLHKIEVLREVFSKPNSVAIHFGSGRNLLSLIDMCERYQIPIIQGSTKLSVPVPEGKNVVIINAPNLSLPMIRFISTFPKFAAMIGSGMNITITESHQNGKVDTSGTARVIAKAISIPESEIRSIRDRPSQIALGIPEEHLDGHAFHFFNLVGQGVEIEISTKVLGRATYAEGALLMAQALVERRDPLSNGIHELKDVLHLIG